MIFGDLCPNVFWDDQATSCQAVRETNDTIAQGQAAHPSRIRWFASLPWEYPQAAVQELARLQQRCQRRDGVG